MPTQVSTFSCNVCKNLYSKEVDARSCELSHSSSSDFSIIHMHYQTKAGVALTFVPHESQMFPLAMVLELPDADPTNRFAIYKLDQIGSSLKL